MDLSELIIAWECGELGLDETVELFQELISLGLDRKLQGRFGRTAKILIDEGYCTPRGI